MTASARALEPAVLAVMLVWQLSSGKIFLYIGDRTLWMVFLAIPVLVALSVVQLRGRAATPAAGGWLLVAPVVVALLVAPQPLGSDALEAQTPGVAAPAMSHWDLSAPPMITRTDQDWDLKQLGLLLIDDSTLKGVDGGRAKLLGFVYRPQTEPPTSDRFFVARFLVRCCTADAVALSFPVRYTGAAELARDTWVEVEGPIVRGEASSRASAYVEGEQLRIVPQPERPYLLL